MSPVSPVHDVPDLDLDRVVKKRYAQSMDRRGTGRSASGSVRNRRHRQPRQMELFRRGGKRVGAGRKPKSGKAGVPHHPRQVMSPRSVVHVTVRMHKQVYQLRSARCFRVLNRAFNRALVRGSEKPELGFRVCHYAILHNHIHLIVEAPSPKALAQGMQGLLISLAMRLNRMMDRHGPVVSDRFHSHVLRSPVEVERAVNYVLNNYAHHSAQWGNPLPPDFVDNYSSARLFYRFRFDPWRDPPLLPIAPPQTWLLREGWQRARSPQPSNP